MIQGYNQDMAENKSGKQVEKTAVKTAGQPTLGKMVRLFLKSLILALIFVILISILSALGVPYLDTIWGKVIVLGVLWVIAYPRIMREFRPSTYMKSK